MEFIKLFEEYNKQRTQAISLEEAVDIYLKSCTDWDINHNEVKSKSLFRGSYTSPEVFYGHAGSEENEKRHSANTSNFYTSIMEHIPSWKKAPSRGESFIMTNEEFTAESFGLKFHMIPFNGTKIGQCPESDIWLTKIKLGIGQHHYTIADFSYEIYNFISGNLLNEKYTKHSKYYNKRNLITQVTPENVIELFNEIEKIPRDELIRQTNRGLDYIMVDEWLENNSELTLFEYIKQILDFDNIGFKVLNKQEEITEKEHEFWSDGKFIGIGEMHWEKFVSMVNKKRGNIIDKY
jgi:hypothetical protein